MSDTATIKQRYPERYTVGRFCLCGKDGTEAVTYVDGAALGSNTSRAFFKCLLATSLHEDETRFVVRGVAGEALISGTSLTDAERDFVIASVL